MSFDALTAAAEKIKQHLGKDITAPKELLASLLLEGDEEVFEIIRRNDSDAAAAIEQIVREVNQSTEEPVEFRLAIRHRDRAEHLASRAIQKTPKRIDLGGRADAVLMHPVAGWGVLTAILYFGFYQFVGVFGAGTVVDFLEKSVFTQRLNPLLERFFKFAVPWPVLCDLFVGEYGVLTLGVRYAVSLILPIVTFFFLMFSIIEDTGYLPRLAMLLDRFFKRIGLSGRAVIPMVLGFGCVTMATLVTRTLPTRRERIIATLLLSLAIPCSVQLGIILALLSNVPKALALWAVTILVVFLMVGSLISQLLPGEAPSFYVELPPLRFPAVSNVLMKTWTRLRWYFWEILPLFLLASVFIWVGRLSGIFDSTTRFLATPLGWLGLPPETAPAFLFGFFRRDYGAAGLYDLAKRGALSPEQLFVSCVALTLFLPCVAQFLVTLKERGWKTGVGISLFTLFFSFGTAFTAHRLAEIFGIFR